jgi:N-acetylglucosamine kinase-like BadF-type ATPase
MLGLVADLGGTRSRVALCDLEGRLLLRREGGPGNPNHAGPEEVSANLLQLLRELGLGPGSGPLRGAAIGMAGRSHEAAAGILRRAFSELPFPALRLLRGDDEIAFRDAFPGLAEGVLLLAGTGSAALARGPAGLVRQGGLGPSVGDEGGGHAIGLAALRAVGRAADGRAPSTPLVAAVFARAGGIAPRELESALRTGRLVPKALVPLVAGLAGAGDPVCTQILREAARDLAELVRSAASQAGLSPPAVLRVTGGLTLVPALLGGIEQELAPAIRLDPRPVDPLRGALTLLLEAESRPAPVPAEW